MAGLVSAIHVLASVLKEDVDARDKHGHDDVDTLCQPHRSSAL
jgi:hypothetical protein